MTMAIDRRTLIAASALLAASARAFPALATDAGYRPDPRDEARIKDLIARMTLAEKLGQMTQRAGGRQKALNSKIDAAALDAVRAGAVGSYLHVAGAEALRKLQRVAVEESRLGIPLLFAMDVVHGYRTIFPVPLGLAASFDPEVARRAAEVAAVEAKVSGLHWTFAPMIDIARDARWGRVVEGAGEDPYLGSRIAQAQIRGLQGDTLASGDGVMACAKHFGAYGAGIGGRDYNDAELSERMLHEVYLAPFQAAVAAGSGSLMTAFNALNGVPTTGNADLVRGVLREDWGYQGLVVSDWNAIIELVAHGAATTPAEAAALALRAGVDMDMTSGTYADHLGEAIAADPALLTLVDQAVSRILHAKARLGLFEDPYRFGDAARERSVLLSAGHRAASRQAAQRSIVLLRNEGDLLPLRKGQRIALIGALADDASSAIGSWRAQGQPDEAVTLRRALEPLGIAYAPGVSPRDADESGIAGAVETARAADIVLLAMGEDFDFSAEARSRSDIGLPGPQDRLIDAIRATGKPIVAILMNGRPLALEAALRNIPAVIESWFLGNQSGPALADILFGNVSPAGRLPMGMPRTSGQLPQYYAHGPTGRPANPDLSVDSSRYHDVAIGPLFPFGHGLGYSSFAYSDLAISPDSANAGATVRIAVTVANTGDRDADEVVQLYIRAPVAGMSRPVKELRGFQRVSIPAGKTRRITFALPADTGAVWDGKGFTAYPGTVEVIVGASSEDIRARGTFRVTGKASGSIAPPARPTSVTVT
ncbi:glycoside hydrolase family 3 N-terminal domain-containing protein [Stakelama pacifica]|uniref:Beta-D-glucoside glucohydrolase n=1 Tax=Stakelama pacifica TaxID=517720 RepID=A0A4R6FY68_9SPHN|nr:glycoside hydrolase family 3 N-terminal domain-containing protein [Stakelama pacifica]TDN86902.1 beta-glucosidase [Stakelama pacifica]GGO91017.1 beta-glucosidase [Stakelama pacifica]